MNTQLIRDLENASGQIALGADKVTEFGTTRFQATHTFFSIPYWKPTTTRRVLAGDERYVLVRLDFEIVGDYGHGRAMTNEERWTVTDFCRANGAAGVGDTVKNGQLGGGVHGHFVFETPVDCETYVDTGKELGARFSSWLATREPKMFEAGLAVCPASWHPNIWSRVINYNRYQNPSNRIQPLTNNTTNMRQKHLSGSLDIKQLLQVRKMLTSGVSDDDILRLTATLTKGQLEAIKDTQDPLLAKIAQDNHEDSQIRIPYVVTHALGGFKKERYCQRAHLMKLAWQKGLDADAGWLWYKESAEAKAQREEDQKTFGEHWGYYVRFDIDKLHEKYSKSIMRTTTETQDALHLAAMACAGMRAFRDEDGTIKGTGFKLEELQIKSGRSRPTVTTYLKAATEAGELVMVGKGRNTFYQLVTDEAKEEALMRKNAQTPTQIKNAYYDMICTKLRTVGNTVHTVDELAGYINDDDIPQTVVEDMVKSGYLVCVGEQEGQKYYQTEEMRFWENRIVNILKHLHERGCSLNLRPGGAGSGKSTVTGKQILALELEGNKVGVFTPTGKSRKVVTSKLPEGVKTIPKTMHSGLGVSVDPAKYDHFKPQWKGKVVVFDESSLADTYTWAGALERLGPGVEQIWLVGDSNQLASVGSGCVFRDLLAGAEQVSEADEDGIEQWKTKWFNIHRMTKNHRQNNEDGAGIVKTALSVLTGKGIEIDPSIQHYQCDSIEDAKDLTVFLAIEESLNQTGSSDVICPYLQVATEIGNRIAGGGVELPIGVGAEIAATVTDHSREVVSGDQGVVEAVTVMKDKETGLQTQGLWINWKNDDGTEHATAWELQNCVRSIARTVHAHQGSEADSIIILWPEGQWGMNTLYTALTRARKRVTIVSVRDSIMQSSKKYEYRRTNLVNLLNQ